MNDGKEDETDRSDLDALLESIEEEMDRRLADGGEARAESYLRKHPQLNDDPKVAFQVISAEFDLRRQHGLAPSLDDFIARFPKHQAQLIFWFGRKREAAGPIRLDCPHCHNPIEVVGSRDAHPVDCPSCHKSVRVDVTPTDEWSPVDLPLIGRYKLGKALGRGAFGTVYQAKDSLLDRVVAVKLPRAGTITEPEDVDRFVREARSVAQLNHPGIVQVYDSGCHGKMPFIVSEYVDGVTLQAYLDTYAFTSREAAQRVTTIATALQHAHNHQVIHRDLKPSNIMLDQAYENPQVMDFGLAKRDVAEITITQEGAVLGTPAYMSPEQARGDAHLADCRSDVYSLGVILFRMLTGGVPFHGVSTMLLNQVMNDEPPQLRGLNDSIPIDLETITLKCLEKDPANRYQTARELADDLQRYLDDEPIHARPISKLERSLRWCKRNPAPTTAGVALLSMFVVASVALWFVTSSRRDERAANAKSARSIQAMRESREMQHQSLTLVSEELSQLPYVQPVRERFLKKAVEDLEQLTKESPNEPDLQLEWGRAFLRLGDVRRDLLLNSSASSDFLKAREIFTAVAQDPGLRTAATLELATCDIQLALLASAEQRFADADQSCQSVIETVNRMLADQPNDVQFLETLGTALANRASALFQLHRRDDAESAARQAIATFRRISSADNPRFQRGLAQAHSILGEILVYQGATDEGIGQLRSACHLLDTLASNYPDPIYAAKRAESRRLLASMLGRLGREAEEEQSYRELIADWQTLHDARPMVPLYRHRLALVLSDLGDLQFEMGRIADAETSLTEAILIMNKLITDFPGVEEVNFRILQAAAQNRLGLVYRDQGRTDQALQLLQRAADTNQKLAELLPNIGQIKQLSAVSRAHWARSLSESGDHATARAEFAVAERQLRELMLDDPESVDYRYLMAHLKWRYGEALAAGGDAASAKQTLSQANDDWRLLLQTPNRPDICADAATFFTLLTDPDFRDADAAVQAASLAVTTAPSNALYCGRLSGARLRAANWEQCLVAAEQARQLRDGVAIDMECFFEAMAHHHLGQNEQAAAAFSEGRRWMQEQRPGNSDVHRLHDEAAELLQSLAGNP